MAASNSDACFTLLTPTLEPARARTVPRATTAERILDATLVVMARSGRQPRAVARPLADPPLEQDSGVVGIASFEALPDDVHQHVA